MCKRDIASGNGKNSKYGNLYAVMVIWKCESREGGSRMNPLTGTECNNMYNYKLKITIELAILISPTNHGQLSSKLYT